MIYIVFIHEEVLGDSNHGGVAPSLDAKKLSPIFE